jgi:hypothetical protein
MPDPVRRRGLLGSGPVAIAAVIALAGCTGAPAARHGATDPVPTPTSASVPARIPNDQGLRGDATMTSCAASSGGWGASGRIVNSTGSARDYRLTVLFTSDTATVIGVGTATVHVAAGAQRDWRIRGAFTPASPTLCVLSGVA